MVVSTPATDILVELCPAIKRAIQKAIETERYGLSQYYSVNLHTGKYKVSAKKNLHNTIIWSVYDVTGRIYLGNIEYDGRCTGTMLPITVLDGLKFPMRMNFRDSKYEDIENIENYSDKEKHDNYFGSFKVYNPVYHTLLQVIHSSIETNDEKLHARREYSGDPNLEYFVTSRIYIKYKNNIQRIYWDIQINNSTQTYSGWIEEKDKGGDILPKWVIDKIDFTNKTHEKRKRKSMNNSYVIFRMTDKVRAINCVYENKEGAKITTYKTMDPTIDIDDLVIIPSGTRHNWSVVKVVEVDVVFDLDGYVDIEWIGDRLNLDSHNKLAEYEKEAIKAHNKIKLDKQRRESAKEFDDYTEGQLKALPLYTEIIDVENAADAIEGAKGQDFTVDSELCMPAEPVQETAPIQTTAPVPASDPQTRKHIPLPGDTDFKK